MNPTDCSFIDAADLYAVIGNPVSHSRSPAIHAAFAAQTGQAMRYEARLAPISGFAATLEALGAEGCAGCNVTVPFKFEAFDLAETHSARARLAGAANTLKRLGSGWSADNTDGAGLVRDLLHNAEQAIRGRRLLLIGAGGAASGVLGPLIEAEPEELAVVNRTEEKARVLVKSHSAWAEQCRVNLRAESIEAPGAGFDLVINATASSLQGARSPVGSEVLGADCLAVDLMYGPAAGAFLGWAASHGARTRDGLGMLIEQAAEAFALWRGVRPQTTELLRTLQRHVAEGFSR